MGILQNITRALGVFKRKSFDDTETISGGFDIFSEVRKSTGIFGGGWGKTKQLQTYSKSLYVFRCVSKIAQKTASIDWEMFKILNKVGDTKEIFVHEALDLLYRPNPFQTKTEFFEKYMINKLLAGQAFVLKVRDNSGKVVELWNLRPDYVTIIKDSKLFIKGYEFSTQGGGRTIFAPEDIIYDSYPSPLDEWGGTSALQASESRVETEEFATRYQSYFFRNNARPDFLLTNDNKITQKQKDDLEELWSKKHKGVENAGKGAYLEYGTKYQQVSISQREMDYIESLKMTRDDILTAFAVPKPIIAITEDVNYANAKTAMEIFLTETITPEIKRITEKLNEHLIYPEYGDIYFIKEDSSYLPMDEKNKADTQAVQIASGTLLINEAREELGREPINGGWSMYMPLSQVPVGGLPQNSKELEGRYQKKLQGKSMKTFRGRGRAMKFIEIKEEVEKTIYEGIAKELKVKSTKENIVHIIKPEVREKYVDVVNKMIDVKSDRFKPEILKFAEQQKARVMKELSDKKSMDTKALGGAFDVAKENKLLAEISLPFIGEFVMSAGADALASLAPAETFDATDRVEKYIKERAKEMAKAINDTTLEKLARTLAEGIEAGEGITALGDRVGVVYEEFPTYRADMIARTEATSANNRGFIEGYSQSGVANAKEWIATGDDRTRDSHILAESDGVIGLDKRFSNGLLYPGDPSGDAGETINCRCVLAPAFKE